MSENRNPDWNTMYTTHSVKQMPWYWPELDPDLVEALEKKGIYSGTFLDLGTGPATQAIGLAKKGFTVTATDISEDAIKKAGKLTDRVEFLQDNILDSRLNRKFDYIFDRGCFHVFSADQRVIYLKKIVKLLNEGGLLFLKCFSDRERDTGGGPYRFSRKMIKDLFGKELLIESIKDTVYQGQRKPKPKALFIVLKGK
jgi:SAM-dependent methyltransferase